MGLCAKSTIRTTRLHGDGRAAGLCNAFFASGVSVVIVEGEFFTPAELDALVAPIPSHVLRDVFTLNVSYPQAWTRVQGDASRGLSKDPVFLTAVFRKFELARPFLTRVSTVVDADAPTLHDVVQRLLPRIVAGE